MRAEHDRGVLAGLLGRDPVLHAYQLGDLDDVWWPFTTWWRGGDEVVLMFHGVVPATVVALARPERVGALAEVLVGAAPVLPARVHAHLSPGVAAAVGGVVRVGPVVAHRRLALTDPGRLAGVRPEGVALTVADLPELVALYAVAYPGNWFDPGMLAAGPYVGLRRGGELVAVAGVHVWSPGYGVAAVGNVATHPRWRGRGLAAAVLARLCGRLRASVGHVVLNVRADNAVALRLYGRLGFTVVAGYEETTLSAWGGSAAG
ncbi:GNAT family N-acetyltransferase [Micromonospora sp. WMMD882]|uniref:GNAT family N-acetyltransferase n=1 Tax=Micromonospora sp. WMMD882 TaxID=3015151 RepID=UPI00248B75E5|nr:GNAT family N-acetyltransferase [Micromonospora sp. WMMD882]WBB80803.1 GNAT family N-acetyltransferase [Micromonospora sp. WMMD882]